MGTCFSKKEKCPASVAAPVVSSKAAAAAPEKSGAKTEHRKVENEQSVVKKEIFVIKRRRSHSNSSDKQIQIQKLPPEPQSRAEQLGFGTPVRTSSCTREEVDAILIQCGRLSRSSSANVTPSGKKNSVSKRSFDFDNEDDDETRRRDSRSATSSPSKTGRRRTPSRERTLVSGSGRRVSRSPGRRSEILAAGVGGVENSGGKPGKMVSVPASVTSSISAGNDQNSSVRRITVRKDVRSPRSQSPAQSSPPPVQQHPPLILSRSNSRKTRLSLHRRKPLSEIDNNHSHQKLLQSSQNQSLEGANRSLSSMRGAKVETIVVKPMTSQVSDNSLQPKFIRSRSWSRSRDLDELVRGVNPNPNTNHSASSYASILLEDIQNFHQKSSSSNVPQCLTKACSIMDAVADVNSTTSSSIASSDDKKLGEMKKFEVREVELSNNLMEPSLHKYVTMRRGTLGGDMGDQESSASNSVAVGCQQRWGSPLEPNSVESVGCLTSKTRIRNKDLSAPLGSQRQEFQ